MDPKTFDKSKLPSLHVAEGSLRAPLRSYYYAMGLTGCDKSLPRVMLAMPRLNVPAVLMYGGSILPGKLKGRDVTTVDVFEAVGQHSAGNMSDEDLHTLECHPCPGAGGGQLTANAMATVSEAIALALPGSAGAPAPCESRDGYAAAELAERHKAWRTPANPYQSGELRKYANQGGPAHKGAVTHAGGEAEVICYADI